MTNKNKSPISRVNNYNSTLTNQQIKNKHHRDKVGGMWEKLGKLQLEFLIDRGLLPQHKLLDIGCGCLRGGLKFIEYLDIGNYCGSDINKSLLEAGEIEIKEANLSHKNPQVNDTDSFDFDCFKTEFDYMIAFSLFTHLHMNLIIKCLKNAYKHLSNGGFFYATFFIVDNSIEERPILHSPGNITTHYIMDPYHYSLEEIDMMAEHTGFKTKLMKDFNHPRSQKMVAFIK